MDTIKIVSLKMVKDGELSKTYGGIIKDPKTAVYNKELHR